MRGILFIILSIRVITLLNGQSLTITNPSGSFNAGQTLSIQWSSTLLSPSTDLTIELVNSQNYKFLTIVESTTNDGLHNWLIPSFVSTGVYKVKICKTENGEFLNFSNLLWIFSQASINLISPIGGENYSTGQSISILWSSTGLWSLPNFLIELVNHSDSTLATEIVRSTLDDGIHEWVIPDTILSGNYKIRIGPPWLKSYSINSFVITKSVLNCNGFQNNLDFNLSQDTTLSISHFTNQPGLYSFSKTTNIQDVVIDCRHLKGLQSVLDSFWIYNLTNGDSCLSYVNIVNKGYCNCTHPDYGALMALYRSTNGDGWINNNGWRDGAKGKNCDPCNGWYGLKCTNNRVHCMDLDGYPVGDCLVNGANGGNNLNGTIPKEIKNLSKLEFLYLTSNKLKDTIPRELFELGELKLIWLAFNNLTGKIPTKLENAKKLEVLMMQNNRLSGTLPKELGDITSLIGFSVSSNLLSGKIPNEISKCLKLQNLFLYSNLFSDTIPKKIGDLSNLQNLHLYNNKFSGKIPSTLGNLKKSNLNIRLDGNNLDGCYDSNLSSLCNKTYNFQNNPRLPWQGDFSKFCNGESQTGAPCKKDGIDGLINSSCKCEIIYNGSSIGDFVWEDINKNGFQDVGEPGLDGVEIEIIDAITRSSAMDVNGQTISKILSNAGGSYKFDKLKPGKYFLKVLKFIKIGQNEYRISKKGADSILGNDIDPNSGKSDTIYIQNDGFILENIDIGFYLNEFCNQDPIYFNLSQDTTLSISHFTNQTSLYSFSKTVNVQDVVIDCRHLKGQQAVLDSFWIYSLITGDSCLSYVNIVNQGYCNCTHPDYGALMALYRSTNGDGWTNNDGWSDGVKGENCDPCKWYGLTCNSNNRLECIDFDGIPNCELFYGIVKNNLTGQIPTEISELSELKFLNFGSNNLVGEIPSSISLLSSLEQLILENNKMEGKIPKELLNLKNLRNLDLFKNKISGLIPDEIYLLENLTELDLGENEIYGQLNPKIANLQNLKIIDISNNKLSGELPKELGMLKKMEYMYLQNNKYNTPLPKEFGYLTNLKYLNIENGGLQGQIPKEMAKLPFLNYLNLKSNNLNGCFDSLSSLCNKSIFFQNNPLLPWLGDFSKFCNGESQIDAPCLINGKPGKIDQNCDCTTTIPCNLSELKPTITYPKEICSNETKTIRIAPIANTTIKANLVTDNTSIQGDENINFSNPQQIILNLKNTSSTTQSTSIKISVEKDGCVFDSIISINVNPELMVNILSNKDTINLIEKTNLTATGLGGSGSSYTYMWQPNGSSSSSVLINNAPIGISKAIVNIKDNKSCEANDSVYLHRLHPLSIIMPDTACIDSIFEVSLSNNSYLDKIKFTFLSGQIINGTNGVGQGPHKIKYKTEGKFNALVEIENFQENNYTEVIAISDRVNIVIPILATVTCDTTVNSIEFRWPPNPSIIKVIPTVITGQSGILSNNSFKLTNLSEEEVTVEFEFETNSFCRFSKVTKTCKTKPCGPIPIFQNSPSDITISCNELPNINEKMKVLDGCQTCPTVDEIQAEKSGQVNACGGDITYTWEYTDACNRTITHAQKITVIPSSIPSFINPPSDITLSCEEIIKTPQALSYSNNEIGSCLLSGSIIGTIIGVIPEKCGGLYTLRWKIEDVCNRVVTHEQKITALPVKQATFETFQKEITVPCDDVPEIKTLNISNGRIGDCGIKESITGQKIEVIKPKEEGLECKGTYHFIWRFTDVCNRTTIDSQIVNVYSKKTPEDCIISERYVDTIMCEDDILYIEKEELSKDNDRVTITYIDKKGCDSLVHYRVEFVAYLCTDNCNDPENYFYPSGFSPNDDGINDKYEILGLEECKELLKDRHIRIINRWGTLVYENKSYDNSWNGEDNNGNPLPEGTYYFDVVLDDLKNIRKNGYVVIIR